MFRPVILANFLGIGDATSIPSPLIAFLVSLRLELGKAVSARARVVFVIELVKWRRIVQY